MGISTASSSRDPVLTLNPRLAIPLAKMSTLIMKFGGASLATIDHFHNIAKIILSYLPEYEKVIVVISAMANMTDQLIDLAKQVHKSPPQREYDMLISVGERISSSLLAMKLSDLGHSAISFTGSQAGIITSCQHMEARIVAVKPHRLVKHLDAGSIIVVAGFQGVSQAGEITTLGRGGTDTTAVALGLAFGAERVLFFKDVPGICDKDPHRHSDARCFETLSYEEAIGIVEQGAKVLHNRALHLAAKNGLPLHVLSFKKPGCQGTTICGPLARRTPPLFEEA